MVSQPNLLCSLVLPKAGVPDPRPQHHRIQEVPFSSDRKRMEVRARPVSGTHCCKGFVTRNAQPQPASRFSSAGPPRKSVDQSLYLVKGMPESILAECCMYVGPDTSQVSLHEDDKALVLNQSRRMAANGLRVLGVTLDSHS